jgi:signal transduction histidine kinase/ligand-binding sensor domain-containing protein/CheY-like chemotaxis protein/AraC-like DNA-binding protein
MLHWIRLIIFCTLIQFLLTATALSQPKCKIEHYSTEDGLSHDGVMCILKDHEGFMWFGTWDGINRFDGHNFITYKSYPGDTSNLKNNRIDDIVEDKGGYLWMKAYDNQVYRFDKKAESFFAISRIIKEPKIKKFVFDKIIVSNSGPVWLITKGEGVFLIPNPDVPFPHYLRFAQEMAQTQRLPSNTINFFHEDDDHNVWIGTPKGLCYLNKDASGTYKNANIDLNVFKNLSFTSITEDSNRILLGTSDGYLIVYNKASKKVTGKKVSNYKLNAVSISHRGNSIYVTTSGSELITVNNADLNSVVSKMAGAEPFFSIYEDKAGLLWIEPEKHGLVKFDPVNKTFKYFFQKNEASYNNADKYYSIFEDNKGILWASMKGGGFGYYNPSTNTIDYFFDEPNIQNHKFSNIITGNYYDPAGILWLSTDDRGINKIIFQGNDFNQHLLVEHPLFKADNEIRGVYNDNNNRLWLGAKSGQLYIYQNGKRVNNLFVNEPSGGLGLVYSILQDRHGVIWLGTKSNGLFKAEPIDKTQTKYRLSHFQSAKNDIYSISSNSVYSILEDKKGRIWVGTFEEGINLVDTKGDKTQFINAKNAFYNYPRGAFDKVRHLAEDAAGNVWIGTTDGLLVFNPDKDNAKNYRFVSYTKISGDKESLGNNDIQYILRDSQNTMWVSTSGGGLNKAIGNDPIKGLKFKNFTTKDGLPSNFILSCVEDNSKNLWLATQNGLSKFNINNNQFKNYDSYDGLPKTEFSESSCLKLPNGSLLLGSIKGYVLFDPDKIVDHKINANMVLTNLQVNNKDISLSEDDGSLLKSNINNTDNLVLKYNQNIITINYTLLDYRSSNKQTYAYRLNGFDKTWNDNKNQRRATYTNLPPGKYVFEVKSKKSNQYSKLPIKKIAVTILPPPWRTWWAYLIYFILMAILIETVRRVAFTMIRLRHRIAVERKLADLKVSFFTNISHELRTPLTLILNPIEELSRKEKLSTQGIEYINVVRKNANRMVRFINQLLDLRKVQSGKAAMKVTRVEMISFIKKISEYFSDVAREKQIDLQILSDRDEIYAWIDAEKIDIVIYNILANAFKFTPEQKSICIQINHNDRQDQLRIEIIDQGIGVANEKLNDIFELYYMGDQNEGNHLKGTGIGLALSKELIALHHGGVFAKNNPGGGLNVTIELKSGNDHFKHNEVVFATRPEVSYETSEVEKFANQVDLPVTKQGNSGVPLVLLVEDNDDLRKFLAVQLSEFYRVAEAGNGEEGLQKALELLPDLILSDVMMPKMDGIQMLDKLKHDLATSHIPVVLLSARFSVESQIEGLKYGADYYISKPFHNDFLLASIENLLKQRKKIFESFLKGKKVIELNPGAIVITSKDEVFLNQIISVVENGMANPDFNIDNVADIIAMSRSAFYKKFKSLTDMAPVEFVREMRLKRAKQYFDAGDHNISEIAYQVGFSNAKYFSTCFKEQYQLSPSEYLKSKASNPQ